MRRSAVLLSLTAVLVGSTTAVHAAPAPVAKALQPTLTQLKAKTTLPILLPSVFPVTPLKGKPLYSVVSAKAKRWDVVLGYVPACNGANVCAAGNLSVEKTARKLTSADGSKVKLRDGVVGRYQPLSCGASCSAPSIAFRAHGVIVTYQLKLDLKKGETDRGGFVKVANSALAGGLR
ncbi:MAG: hypothetical protein JWO02_1579 [Solirubrobacterales bacterium]|nr:hypothetical protein [Solirubrobacterales bacterium]